MFHNHTWDCACAPCVFQTWLDSTLHPWIAESLIAGGWLGERPEPTAESIAADRKLWRSKIGEDWDVTGLEAHLREVHELTGDALRERMPVGWQPVDHYSSDGTGQRGTIACSPQLRLGNVVDDWAIVTCQNCLRFDPTD